MPQFVLMGGLLVESKVFSEGPLVMESRALNQSPALMESGG